MIEVWKDIQGFEGYYQVSNLGRVRSLDRKIWDGVFYQYKKGKILHQQINVWGYLKVNLSKHHKSKCFIVHRLVAQAFIPIDRKRKFINHIDGNKLNNRVDNLERCTTLENNRHAIITGLKGVSNGLSTPIICVETEEQFESIRQASRVKGISPNALLYCLKGVTKTSAGFHWKYA